jgi:hypothetical protein
VESRRPSSRDVQRSNHVVLIHAQDGGEVHGWWKTFTFDGLTVGECPSDLRRHLIVDKDCIVLVDLP